MKKIVLLFSALLCLHSAYAQSTSYNVISNSQHQTVIDVKVGAIKQLPVMTPNGNEVKITVDKGTQLLQQGSPDLPKLAFSIIIPNQANSTISVMESQYTDIPMVAIAPSKGSFSRAINPSTVPFIYGDTYQKDGFFPAQTAILNQPYILRDFRGQTVMINPVQYNPVTKTMRVYSHFKLNIEYTGVSNDNFLSSNERPNQVVEEFDGIYQNQFINYKTTGTTYTPLNEQGSLLIISPAAYLGEIAPLVKWKKMKGIKTYLVNTDTLSGGVNSTTIKALVKSYYQEKQIAYLIIVGDDTNIPPITTTGVVAGPSDIAYAYINGNDHYPEFSVGRLSGESISEIRTQVTRTLNYEQTPNTNGNWMRTQIGIGSEFGTGDDNQYDFDHIHEIVDSNKNQYYYLTNVEGYDDTCTLSATLLGTDQLGYPTATMLSTAINNGASLINYCGHGGPDGIVTTSFSSSDIPSLQNYNQLPFIFVVGCSPGEFVSYSCFAENMQRARTTSFQPYGTISNYMSSIAQYWDEPMQAQDEFNAILRGARPSNLKARLGVMCADASMSMNDQYNIATDPLAGSDMTDTWIFFGDPTVSIYTKNEGTLTLGYDVHITQNSTTYEIHCPVDGATIGLYYQGEYLASSIVNGGIAYFTFPPLTFLDTVFITATKQNYVPASGSALVVNWATGISDINVQSNLVIYPNPATDFLQINTKENAVLTQVQIIDINGKIVRTLNVSGNHATLNTTSLIPGTYILQAITDKGISRRPFSKK
jgi:gingipain R